MLSTHQRPSQDPPRPFASQSSSKTQVVIPTSTYQERPNNFIHTRQNGLPWWEKQLHSSARKAETSLQAHIKSAGIAVSDLLKRDQRNEKHRLYEQALDWLAMNRKSYAGQWIALCGAQLLAAGTNAKEVYARVRGHEPPAFILKIEAEDLPFAGW